MNEKQYNNTLILRDVLKRKIKKDEPIEVLNFWSAGCGTYGCVAGDTVIALNFNGYSDSAPNTLVLKREAYLLSRASYDVFGFDCYSRGLHVFGDMRAGSLEKRLEYVETQLIKYIRVKT